MVNIIVGQTVKVGVAMLRLLNWFTTPDLSSRLKADYLLLKKIHIINYDGLWCLRENDCLLALEEKGTGG